MRILIATPLYPPQVGGPAKYAQSLEREWVRQGHRVRVLAYGRVERVLPPGVRHALFFVRAWIALAGCDALLALDTVSVGVPAVAAARLRGTPAAVRIAGDFVWEQWIERTGEPVPLSRFYTEPRRLTRKERLLMRLTRRLLRDAIPAFTTPWQRDLWERAYQTMPRAAVVENFYPTPGDPVPARGRVFVAAGRDIALKNKTLLRRAFADVARRHPGITLDERQLPPEAHAARLAGAYAVIVPSISEVNPNTAIEAAAARKPFVAPEDCGGRERLDGMGLFVDTRDERALASGIERLLDGATYDACVEASGRLRPHGWDEIAREYLALFRPGGIRLLVIGPRQSALAASPAGRERAALQAAQVERYTTLTPAAHEGNVAAARRMLREARKLEVDVVSSQDPFFAGLVAWRAARRAHARLNVQVHADLSAQSPWRRGLAHFVLRRADSVRAVSHKIADQVRAAGSTAPVTVLPIFVDLSAFRAVAVQPHAGKTLLWVGRFEEEKDPFAAVALFKTVHGQVPDARMIMLGDGSLRERAASAARGLPVEFAGWQDPLPYLARADAVVSTSRYEGFGASIIEALAAGVPVVAPDVGIAREAGATVVPRERLAGAVVETLRAGARGHLRLAMPAREEWAATWAQSLL